MRMSHINRFLGIGFLDTDASSLVVGQATPAMAWLFIVDSVILIVGSSLLGLALRRAGRGLLKEYYGSIHRSNRMQEQTTPDRMVGVGFLSNVVAGLITGIAARIVMRIVALTAHLPVGFTAATLIILFFGLFCGVIGGIVYIVRIAVLSSSPKVSKYLPGPIWRGLAFGVLLLVIVGLPSVLIPLLPKEDLALGIPLLNKIMFGVLSIIYGLTLGVAEKVFDHYLPRRTASNKTGISVSMRNEE